MKTFHQWLDAFEDELVEHFHKEGIYHPTSKDLLPLYNKYKASHEEQQLDTFVSHCETRS